MDLSVLKRKISSYKTSSGTLKNVPDDLLLEVLSAWELWQGPASGFYDSLGVNYKRFASFLGRAKKLKQEGHVLPEFKELKIDSETGTLQEPAPCTGAEIVWQGGHVIRFSRVDLLLEFLKRAA